MFNISIVQSEIDDLVKGLKKFISQGKDPVRVLQKDVLLNKKAHPYNKMLVQSAIFQLRKENSR